MSVPIADVLLLIVVTLGALVQGSIGFGFALIVVPAFLIMRPEALPATVLLLVLPLAVAMAFREHKSVDLPGLFWVASGRLVGTVGGVGLLITVPAGYLSILLGGLILLIVGLSVLSPNFEAKSVTRLAGGVASGIMGTAVAVSGPPLALVYQNRPGPELRSTLSLIFLLGTAMSLIGLMVAGELEKFQLFLAIKFLPGMALGLWGSTVASGFLDEKWLRPAILAFAGTCGFGVCIMGLTS